MKSLILAGTILVSVGIALLLLSFCWGNGTRKNIAGQGKETEACKGPLYAGHVNIGGKEYSFNYRRYVPPINLPPGFKCDEATNGSPLHTVLSEYSKIFHAKGTKEGVSDYTSLFANPGEAQSDVEDTMRHVGMEPTQYFEFYRKRFDKIEVVGEVITDRATVIVQRLTFQGEPMYQGTCLVERNGQYLIDLRIKEEDPFLRNLSADEYGVVTGVKPK
jgi:hypothetical protein